MIVSAVNPPLLRWCVVVTPAGKEKFARRNLLALAKDTPSIVEIYLPMRLGHPRSKNPLQPFFPRHVFVRLDLSTSAWNPIFSTEGVDRVLMAGDRPGWVRDDRIADIKSREQNGYVVLVDAPPPPKPAKPADDAELPCPWEPGERVVLPDLPWPAVFNKRLDRNRVEILVSVLGSDSKPAKVTRHLSDLGPAPST